MLRAIVLVKMSTNATFSVPVGLTGSVQSDLSNPDRATEQTIAVMIGHIDNEGANDPAVQAAAKAAAVTWRGGPLFPGDLFSPAALAESCWWAAKNAIKFVHHQSQLREWLNRADELQLLITPAALVRMRKPEGDCAIFTMLICAFLKCLGVPYEIVTAAVDPNDPELFSHVWPRAVMPDGTRISLDASHGEYPGWQVPKEHIFRLQVWDAAGNAVPDEGARSWNGLHGYHMRGMGLTDNIDYAGPELDTGSYYNPTQETGNFNLPAASDFSSGSPSSGNALTNLFASLANQWTQIGSRVIAPTTTVQRDQYGNVIMTAPSSSPSASLIAAGGAIPTSTSTSSMLWMAAIVALVLVFAVSKKS